MTAPLRNDLPAISQQEIEQIMAVHVTFLYTYLYVFSRAGSIRIPDPIGQLLKRCSVK